MPIGLQVQHLLGKRQIWELRCTTIGLFGVLEKKKLDNAQLNRARQTHTQVDNTKSTSEANAFVESKENSVMTNLSFNDLKRAPPAVYQTGFDLFFMMFDFWKSQIDLDILCGVSLLTIPPRVKRLDWGVNLFKARRWWGAQWREMDNPTSIKSRSTSRQTAAQGANTLPCVTQISFWKLVWHSEKMVSYVVNCCTNSQVMPSLTSIPA